MESFQETDSALFFGREDLTGRLLGRLSDARPDRLVAVVGASGSGKSSLVRAGMIPKIRGGALPGSADWIVTTFTPGPRPTEAMAARLLPIIGGSRMLPEVLGALERGAEALHQLAEGLLVDKPESARLLLIVDQFEEAFTRASESEAQRFIDLLVTAVTIESGRTFALLTMRADFFDRLSGHPTLARLFEDENLLIVTEMSPDGLRRSIENPAAVVGLTYDHGLVDSILEDVRQQPGSLPLMQYALKRLYEGRDGRRLTKKAYADMGGVRGALAEHAESLYSRMDAATQNAARRLLLRLVEVSGTGEATRRRVPRESLTFAGIPPETVDGVITTLTNPENRLLTASREVGGEGETSAQIEVAHEALLREWKRLKEWIAEDQADLHYGGELLKNAQDWQNAEQSTDYLLKGARVAPAALWLERGDASDLQREFIFDSQLELISEDTRKWEQQARELELAKRAEAAEKARATRFQRWALLSFVGAVLAVVMLVTASVATLNTNATLATVQFEATVGSLRSDYDFAFLQRHGVLPTQAYPLPLGTSAPATAIALATEWAAPVTWTLVEKDDFDDGVPMMQVPAGCFYMGSGRGSTDELPVNKVCLDEFWIDQTEVTQGDFARLDGVQANPPDNPGDRHPVENVTWLEARDFCEKREARLPTEAEWEYVARGPNSLIYSWGNEWNDNNAVWNSHEAADVGSKPDGASWVGALDISGNVWEWTSSHFVDYPYDSKDGRESDSGNRTDAFRVVRGGSADGSSSVSHLRGAARSWNCTGDASVYGGFRCGRS